MFGGGLEVIRAGAAGVAMPTPGDCKRIDVISHIDRRHLAGIGDTLFDSLLVEAAKEGFGNCVVPTVASSAHAGLGSVFTAEATPIITTVLASLLHSEPWPPSVIQDFRCSVLSQSAKP